MDWSGTLVDVRAELKDNSGIISLGEGRLSRELIGVVSDCCVDTAGIMFQLMYEYSAGRISVRVCYVSRTRWNR